VPLVGLRAALDGERYEAAVGAAKELVEAASKVVLARAGAEPPARASVASPTTLALWTGSGDSSDGDLARRLSGVVEALGNLRMEVGTGHGRAEQEAVDAEVARLAASVACGIARFVLSGID
jgi:Abortive infection C-terminus